MHHQRMLNPDTSLNVDNESRAGWLPYWRLLRASGEDAASWLQGQVTNDLRPLDQEGGRSVYTLITNTHGGIVSDAWIHREQDCYFLAVPCGAWENVQSHFERFLVMEDVDLFPMPHHRLLIWSSPPADATWPQACTNRGMAASVASHRFRRPSVECWVSADDAAEAEASLREALTAERGTWLTTDQWELLRIARGVPRWGVDFDERRLPQQASLKHAVYFGKGCYQGQEAIVMLEHRGKLGRKLTAFCWSGDQSPKPDTILRTEDGTEAGWLCSSALDVDAGKVFALGYLKRPYFNLDCSLRTDGGPPIERSWNPDVA